MSIVGGLDIHRKQLTFDYLGTVTGQVVRGRVAPADRERLRAWLARFAGRGDVAFAAEGCTGWRYVAEELAAAGIGVHLAEPAGTGTELEWLARGEWFAAVLMRSSPSVLVWLRYQWFWSGFATRRRSWP